MIDEKEVREMLFNEYKRVLQYKEKVDGNSYDVDRIELSRHSAGVETCLIILGVIERGKPFAYKTVGYRRTFWTNTKIEVKENYTDMMIRLTEEYLKNKIKT